MRQRHKVDRNLYMPIKITLGSNIESWTQITIIWRVYLTINVLLLGNWRLISVTNNKNNIKRNILLKALLYYNYQLLNYKVKSHVTCRVSIVGHLSTRKSYNCFGIRKILYVNIFFLLLNFANLCWSQFRILVVTPSKMIWWWYIAV